MKAVVIGIGSGASMDPIMAVYPRHKALVDAFVARKSILVLSAKRAQVGRHSLTAVFGLPHHGQKAILACRVPYIMDDDAVSIELCGIVE